MPPAVCQLVLASASAQRRKLMRHLGLAFVVEPSFTGEKDSLSRGIVHLVKHNALLKARDAASRRRHGIVIGCDTVVYSHKKRLILKPKNLAQARRNLVELMEKPHWVYSGIALVDASTKKTLVGHEKTKVFMNKLSLKQINRYHALVSPLDKAGGFDIEGKGGLFIPRIEGCFYNVVGLPLAKLVEMLKAFKVDVL